MTFTELLRNVGLFGAAVMCCLAALSVFSVAVIVDKHRRFRLAARQSQIFKPMFTKFLHGGEIQELIDAVRLHENSHVAQVVSGGIAEALVTTALGIFVAIPAVVAYNHFTGKIETFHVQMNRTSSQLVNCLFKVPQVMDRELREPQVVEQVKVAMVNAEEDAYAAR